MCGGIAGPPMGSFTPRQRDERSDYHSHSDKDHRRPWKHNVTKKCVCGQIVNNNTCCLNCDRYNG